MLGDYECKITQATATRLICSPVNIPFGTYNFLVNVQDKGSAEMVINKYVTFSLTVSSISPLSSGTGG